ncbi:hypothetical protein Aph02nite_39730 [Actinoplanes philippinensis]|uniref:Uncharacterized protein n=1 Tax=Actinoplanes philippinensis TaxID=35752 RepID=A0A1I2GPZ7_9ACTN|nr:hypothetical protein [Actinoplanes philippinensis]GIE78023.1 hypothetical protein Aph02nite_39730 [Actinoplanes philippinensis]SFF20024.1 hypothetical protein SAMN05421541_107106 [Actinoplanes philippinensis]
MKLNVEMSPAEENIRSVWLTLREPDGNQAGMSPAKFSSLCAEFGIDPPIPRIFRPTLMETFPMAGIADRVW